MGSTYGRRHGLVCEMCGLQYDDMRTGFSFTDIRNLIITIQVDKKTGKTKYGRRHGCLGYAFELKQMMWKQHIGECGDQA